MTLLIKIKWCMTQEMKRKISYKKPKINHDLSSYTTRYADNTNGQFLSMKNISVALVLANGKYPSAKLRNCKSIST